MPFDPEALRELMPEVRRRALVRELQRVLKLVYGDDWEDVYEDLMINFDPEDYCDA